MSLFFICTATDRKAPATKSRQKIWKQCRDKATNTVTKWGADPNKKLRMQRARIKKRKQFPQVQNQSKGQTQKMHTKSLSKKAAGTSASGRGLRGQRIGEARHPGPTAEEHLTMWSQNIRSFSKHGMALLDRAQKEGIQLVAMQEINLTQNLLPSIVNNCSRKGWQMLAIPTNKVSSNRGGWLFSVGILLP